MNSLVNSCTCPEGDQTHNVAYWDDAVTNWATHPGPEYVLEINF